MQPFQWDWEQIVSIEPTQGENTNPRGMKQETMAVRTGSLTLTSLQKYIAKTIMH